MKNVLKITLLAGVLAMFSCKEQAAPAVEITVSDSLKVDSAASTVRAIVTDTVFPND